MRIGDGKIYLKKSGCIALTNVLFRTVTFCASCWWSAWPWRRFWLDAGLVGWHSWSSHKHTLSSHYRHIYSVFNMVFYMFLHLTYMIIIMFLILYLLILHEYKHMTACLCHGQFFTNDTCRVNSDYLQQMSFALVLTRSNFTENWSVFITSPVLAANGIFYHT